MVLSLRFKIDYVYVLQKHNHCGLFTCDGQDQLFGAGQQFSFSFYQLAVLTESLVVVCLLPTVLKDENTRSSIFVTPVAIVIAHMPTDVASPCLPSHHVVMSIPTELESVTMKCFATRVN